MSIVYLLVPFSLLLGLGFVALFIWNTKNDQFEDLVTPALRILEDENNDFIQKGKSK